MASIIKNIKFLGGAIQCINRGQNIRRLSSAVKYDDINIEYYHAEDEYLTQQAILHSTSGVCQDTKQDTKSVETSKNSKYKYNKYISFFPKKVNYKTYSENLEYDKYFHTMAFIHSNHLSLKDYQKYEKYFDSK